MKPTLFDLYLILCQAFLLTMIFRTAFTSKKKYDTVFTFLSFSLSMIIIECSINNLWIRMLLIVMLCTMIACFFYQSAREQLFLMSVCTIVGLKCITITMMAAFSLLIYHQIDLLTMRYHLLYPLIVLSAYGLCYYVVGVFIKIKKRCILPFNPKNTWILSALLMLIYYITVSLIDFTLNKSIAKLALFYSFLCLTLLLFGMVLTYYYMQLQSVTKVQNELKIQAMSMQIRNNAEILAMNTEALKLKHDMKHLLAHIQYLLDTDMSSEASKELKEYLGNLNQLESIFVTRNPAINFVLNSKYKLAQEKGLAFTCKIMSIKEYLMPDVQLVLMLSNLLDNAIENCAELGTVCIEFDEIHHIQRICITNTVTENILIQNPQLKSNKPNHGYGIESVRAIIKQTQGDILFECDNHHFTVVVILP